jgi:carbon monoxide dehydrogenase subunit G
MPTLTVSETVEAPVDTVFERCSDVTRWAETVSGINKIEVLTEGPVGDGFTFRETRTMFGREATEEMTFAEFSPPGGYVLLAESHGARYRTTHRFEPADGGTRVTLTFEATPVSLGAKIMSPLMRFMKKGLEKCLRDDLADIKKAIESGAR